MNKKVLNATSGQPHSAQAQLSTQSEASAKGKSDYYNLITRGVGVIRRIRTVQVKKKAGAEFYSADVFGFHGAKENPSSARFSIRFMKPCLDAVEVLREASNNKKLDCRIGFEIASGCPESYEYTKDGKPALGYTTRARLMKILWATIGGELVYGEQPADDESDYYSLLTSGVGYLNQVRDAKNGKSGEKFTSLSITALEGAKMEAERIPFSVKVTPTKTLKPKVELLRPAVEQEQKVFVAFTASSCYADGYTIPKDGSEVLKIIMRGYLKDIRFASVNGEQVTLEESANDEGNTESEGE